VVALASLLLCMAAALSFFLRRTPRLLDGQPR
jgi:hypothetical protein